MKTLFILGSEKLASEQDRNKKFEIIAKQYAWFTIRNYELNTAKRIRNAFSCVREADAILVLPNSTLSDEELMVILYAAGENKHII